MRKSAEPGTCPFCGDRLKRRKNSPLFLKHCGDTICSKTAYQRTYARDRRRELSKPCGEVRKVDGGFVVAAAYPETK